MKDLLKILRRNEKEALAHAYEYTSDIGGKHQAYCGFRVHSSQGEWTYGDWTDVECEACLKYRPEPEEATNER